MPYWASGSQTNKSQMLGTFFKTKRNHDYFLDSSNVASYQSYDAVMALTWGFHDGIPYSLLVT